MKYNDLNEKWSECWFQLILDHPDKPWDWKCISENPNITCKIVHAYPDKPWNQRSLLVSLYRPPGLIQINTKIWGTHPCSSRSTWREPRAKHIYNNFKCLRCGEAEFQFINPERLKQSFKNIEKKILSFLKVIFFLKIYKSRTPKNK